MTNDKKRMPLLPALQVLADWRTDEIVVTTMGSAREWPKLSRHPLDFQYIPSAMGHAPALALGLALAQPDRRVLAFNGDGCTLMSLGSLVTIAASGATNLSLVMLDNGIYEVTGGQATAASGVPTDFAALARAAGIRSVAAFNELSEWQRQAAAVLAMPGPRFVSLAVEPVVLGYQLPTPVPMAEQIARLREALGV
ncbi:MAG TPA: thiamine pyrophosphate-dependent enzyme [Pirellulales bacterium]|nr:thiamine pyrophosphate-dependent enzyme [Pirellulales bacterium]